jgi:hypothetical protein
MPVRAESAPAASSKRPARACSTALAALHEESDDLGRQHRRAIESLGAGRERHDRLRSEAHAWRSLCRGHHASDAEGAGDVPDLLAVDADDGAHDVVAGRQQRRRHRTLDRAPVRRISR